MDPVRVAVATVTWARSADEETLLRRSLRLLAEAGLPMAIADTGARPAFTTFLHGLPGARVTVPEAQGLVPQVQASLALAAAFDRPFVLYTEPDKAFFFEHRLRRFVKHIAEEEDGLGVALASRSPDSFMTF